MTPRIKKVLLAVKLICAFATLKAQTQRVQQGVVFKTATSVRLANVTVKNKRAGHAIVTNNLGLFSILASSGDTLEISHKDFETKEVVVSTFQDLVFYLTPSSYTLAEVKIKAESVKQQLQETANGYRSRGIYYNGRPPWYLLLPFGGSPMTFFYELLSKDGKRARRFQKFAETESDYYEIATRFNDYTIKRIVPIAEQDLPEFKSTYRPGIELIRKGTDFELFSFIKTSYQHFLKVKETKSKSAGDSTGSALPK